jgi:hypothetical protein
MRSNSAHKKQIDKFREAARELGTDESEERFNETLQRIGKAKPKHEKSTQGRE